MLHAGGNNWKSFLPSVFDWKKMIENESCLNTPPVYAIYIAGLCFDWLVPLVPFCLFVCLFVCLFLFSAFQLGMGGLEEVGRRNEAKSEKLYRFLDQSKLYCAPVAKEFRSRMNVDFRVRASEEGGIVSSPVSLWLHQINRPTDNAQSGGSEGATWNTGLEARLVKEAEERGLLNLKGYRTVGGMRASLYNALPEEGVDQLVTFLSEFEEAHLS